MDVLSLIGLLISLCAIVIGNGLEGGSIAELINGPAFVIVMGGSVGAVLLQTPWGTLKHSMSVFSWVFRPPPKTVKDTIKRIVRWSEIARREGLLGLEALAEEEEDPVSRNGLWLLVDGYDTQQIRHIMENELIVEENRGMMAANVYESLGAYAPTIGIVGAVLGLIQVMYNLTDPSLLGPGIATAFVATIYGVASANLIFLPIAQKLRSIVLDQAMQREVLIEGLVALAEGDNPRMIRVRLSGYVRTIDPSWKVRS